MEVLSCCCGNNQVVALCEEGFKSRCRLGVKAEKEEEEEEEDEEEDEEKWERRGREGGGGGEEERERNEGVGEGMLYSTCIRGTTCNCYVYYL